MQHGAESCQGVLPLEVPLGAQGLRHGLDSERSPRGL